MPKKITLSPKIKNTKPYSLTQITQNYIFPSYFKVRQGQSL